MAKLRSIDCDFTHTPVILVSNHALFYNFLNNFFRSFSGTQWISLRLPHFNGNGMTGEPELFHICAFVQSMN